MQYCHDEKTVAVLNLCIKFRCLYSWFKHLSYGLCEEQKTPDKVLCQIFTIFQGIVCLGLLFETLLQTHEAELFFHLKSVGCQPYVLQFMQLEPLILKV